MAVTLIDHPFVPCDCKDWSAIPHGWCHRQAVPDGYHCGFRAERHVKVAEGVRKEAKEPMTAVERFCYAAGFTAGQLDPKPSPPVSPEAGEPSEEAVMIAINFFDEATHGNTAHRLAREIQELVDAEVMRLLDEWIRRARAAEKALAEARAELDHCVEVAAKAIGSEYRNVGVVEALAKYSEQQRAALAEEREKVETFKRYHSELDVTVAYAREDEALHWTDKVEYARAEGFRAATDALAKECARREREAKQEAAGQAEHYADGGDARYYDGVARACLILASFARSLKAEEPKG